MGKLKRFFIMCAGADLSIMEDPRCVIEHTKYAAIGATVLSTAVLASLSGGYAIYMTFRSVPKSICLGVLWGPIIFNLDRYIVSSLRRQRISPTLTVKERLVLRGREIGRAVPRLLLAVLISIVITRPIELKLFDREINAYVEDVKSKKLVEIEQQKRLEFPVINELNAENERLRQEIKNKETHCDELHELAMAEATGKSEARTSGRPGKGPLFQERWENYHKCRDDLGKLRTQTDPRITANQQRIVAAEADREMSIKAARATIEGIDGLLTRLKGHSQLTGQNFSIALASLLIIALFILLETAPIIVKLLSERGPYEDIFEAKEHEVYVAERRKISNINDDANTQVSLRRRRNAAILDAESRFRKSLIASMETLAVEELRKARKEVATTLVEHWKTAELKNVEARFGASDLSNNGHRGARVFADGAKTVEATATTDDVNARAPDSSQEVT